MNHIPDDPNTLDNELRSLFTRATAQIDPPPDLPASLTRRLAQPDTLPLDRRRRAMSIAATLSAVVIVALLVGVLTQLGGRRGLTTGPQTGSTPTQTTPFTVSAIDLVVKPSDVSAISCGTTATFTYTATFSVPAGSAGGTIQFDYTLNNGRSQTPASVVVPANATTATSTFTSTGTLQADHTYPGPALVMVTSPNSLISAPAQPSGACATPTATVTPTTNSSFQVTSVSMAVSPTSITGKACGSQVTVTYTATFHLAANGPGGPINFTYTVSNGRAASPASITVAPGQTTATYKFTWSGPLPLDHTYPEQGGVMVTGPNSVQSPLVGPTGTCS